MTPARVFAFLMVNWLCSSKDGLGLAGGLHSSYRLLLDRAWPNLLRKWKGLPVDLNLINGQPRNLTHSVLTQLNRSVVRTLWEGPLQSLPTHPGAVPLLQQGFLPQQVLPRAKSHLTQVRQWIRPLDAQSYMC